MIGGITIRLLLTTANHSILQRKNEIWADASSQDKCMNDRMASLYRTVSDWKSNSDKSTVPGKQQSLRDSRNEDWKTSR